jgi:hypothetical protein
MLKGIIYLLDYFQINSNVRLIHYKYIYYTYIMHIFNILLVYETYKHVRKNINHCWMGS